MMLSDLVLLLERDGWTPVRMRGPHRQYVHPARPGLLTIRRHLTHELAPGAVNNVLQQAGVAT